MIKISISGLWDFTSSSLGAQALSEGIIFKIKELFNTNEINSLGNLNLFKGSKRIVLFANNKKWLYRYIIHLLYFIYRLKYHKRREIIRKSDLLLINGDGIVADIFVYNTLMLALDIRSAMYYEIPVVSLNQSVNVTKGSFAEYIVSKYFITNDISVRELDSKGIIKNLYSIDVPVSIDSAFLIEKLNNSEKESFNKLLLQIKREYDFDEYLIVGIRGNRPKGQFIDVNSWEEVIKYLNVKLPNKKILLASTCAEYDIPLALEIKKRIEDSLIIDEFLDWGKYNYRFFLHFISKAYLNISDRYHQNVLSFVARTPFIPVEGNTSKSSGLRNLLGYPIDVLKLPNKSNFYAYKKSIDFLIENYEHIKNEIDQNLIFEFDNYENILAKYMK